MRCCSSRRPAASGSTCASSWPATASSASSTRPYASLEPVVLDRCQIARFDRRGVAAAPRLRRAPPARGRRRERARRVVGRAAPVRAEPLLQRLGRGRPRDLGRGRGDPRRRCWPTATARTCTSSRRSATRHIDTAWLWPLAETHRKLVRTFSSQTAYMERYPEFRFACSQAQQYDWIRTRNPDLYERIRRHAEAGRWVPVGGTWVEPDCNLPSGESLVRQFLYGQRFFEREFGRRCREFWNPDVFGYNGQLPQIMRGAGIDRFLTQKLSWNRFNPPPHHTFTWQGIDGSRGARALPAGRHLQRHRRDRGAAPERARLQGSRPLRPQPAGVRLRRRRRRADAGDARDAAPRARPAGRAAHHDDAPPTSSSTRWRPTPGSCRRSSASSTSSTTAARTRPRPRSSAGNREGERALHDAELLSAVAARVAGGEHPRGRLDGLWQLLLLNQFHDILPGSSIALGVRGRGPRPRRGARRGRRRRRGGAGGARRRGRADDAAQHDRGRAGRGGDARTASSLGRGAGLRLRRGRRARRARSRSIETADGDRARERPAAGRAGPRRPAALAGRARDRARGAGRAGQRPAALRRPPDGVRRLGRRPVPPGDGRRRPAGDVVRR